MEDQSKNLPVKSPLAALGLQLQYEPDELKKVLKATAFKGCQNDEQFMALVLVAQTYKLNPFLRQIYAFPGRAGEIVPIVPIDGWIALVQGRKEYDGVEQKENHDPQTKDLISVTTTLYRKDQSRPTIHTEYLKECFRDTDTWKKWTVRMLCWKSYIQTARMAFGFAGIYDEDEAARIEESQPELVGKPIVAMPEEIPATVVEPPKEEPPAEAQKAEEPKAPEARTESSQTFKPTVANRKERGWISDAQEKRLWAIANQYGVAAETVMQLLDGKGIKFSYAIPWKEYDKIIDAVKTGGTPPMPGQ